VRHRLMTSEVVSLFWLAVSCDTGTVSTCHLALGALCNRLSCRDTGTNELRAAVTIDRQEDVTSH
jgi:hypothetical protein